MIYRKKVSLVSIFAFFLVILVITGSVLNSKISLKHFFDDWKPQSDVQVLTVVDDTALHYGNTVSHLDLSQGIVEEIYCVKNNRVYFCYSTALSESDSHREWHIGSTTLTGDDFRDHRLSLPSSGSTYVKFSYDYQAYGNYGGLYQDGKIFLRGKDKTLAYDIDADAITTIDTLPSQKYRAVIENPYTIVLEDSRSLHKRTITLDKIAKENEYANEILKLKPKKRWDGLSYLSNFFANVKIVDGDIYLICEIFNGYGKSFTVLFQYDFHSDRVYYLSSSSCDRAHHCMFAPIYE